MKKFPFLFLAYAALLAVSAVVRANDAPRQRIPLDEGWRFFLGDPSAAATSDFDDSMWRSLTLPHDWSIEDKINAKAPMGGGGGFFQSGVAWYRQKFDAPANWQGKRVEVEFEGVYMNADIYLNGQKIDNHPNGYTSFFVDLSSALKPGRSNLLAVRVDNSKQKNTRWYSGSGIYRHVWLHVTDPIHVANWGTFVSTGHADSQAAAVSVQIAVCNKTSQPKKTKLRSEIIGPDGTALSEADAECFLPANGSQEVVENFNLKNPPLWSPETPQISKTVTHVIVDGSTVDTVTTPFGIRELQWSAARGLTINGKTYKLKGGCIHGDNGVLGVAAFDRAEERKIELLKAAGFNALRMSHNPPSPMLLDVCDRLGILVMDEIFDCWTEGKNSMDYHLYFENWWRRDLDSMVLRDRNHPSIIMWNIGNEIFGIFGHENVASYGPKLTAEIHSLDKTRPVTNAVLGWPVDVKKANPTDEQRLKNANLNWDCLDIVGSNYAIEKHVNEHAQHPDRVLVSTESYPPLGEPRHSLENVHVVGDFVWAAQDYLGEVGVGRWLYEGDPTEPLKPPSDPKRQGPMRPVSHGTDVLYPWHGANPGLLDILGNPKPALSYWNVSWQTGMKLGIGVRQPQGEHKVISTPWGWYPTWHSWTWPGWEGKTIEVEVYSNYEKTRLYLNDKQVGEEPTKNSRAIYKVAYQPGILKVVGLENEREVGDIQIQTAGEPAAIRLTPDRASIKANGQDLSFIQIEVLDKEGNVQPNANELIHFTLTGPGSIAGLGNANLKSEEPYQGTQCHVYHGKALVVIRSSKEAGTIRLQADADGVASAETLVKTE